MIEEIKSLISPKYPLISNLSNVSALLNTMDDINWAGFYLVKEDGLYLGPFQGEVACFYIPFDKGVIGYTYNKKETVIVDNVLEFKGHIACSSASRSEIVVPIFKDNNIVAVIDIDSPKFNRFTDKDKKDLEEISKILSILF